VYEKSIMGERFHLSVSRMTMERKSRTGRIICPHRDAMQCL